MKRGRVVATGVAVACGALGVAALGQAQVAPQRASAFPMPGSPVGLPGAQISLRGARADQIGAVEVSGSRSGAHPGTLRAHRDGRGASFIPQRPFTAGETVTVRTALDIPGARDGDFTFTVAHRPSFRSGGDGTLKLPPLPPAAIDHFRSRPDMESPVVRINRRTRGTQRGLIFLAPFSPKGSPRPDGPMITDDRGDLVWFKPVRRGTAVTDLKVQQLDGRPVITWWEGRFAVGWGYGAYKVFDRRYRQVATVRAANGLTSDLHDMQLTDRGTALVLSYDRIKRDLRFVGGARHGRLVDNVVQEVDLKTGDVLFEWHSAGQVPVLDSMSRPDGPRSWDYFHLNAVEEDTDGNLIISSRNTCALYKLDRETGAIIWQLGGKGNDFKMGRGTRFCFQHDVRRAGPGRISLFDNSAGPPVLRRQSRGLVLGVDEAKKTVRLVHQYEHPGGISAPNQGSVRVQPNGDVFVGWGAAPVFSEFSPGGRLLFDGRLTKGKGNYRAIRERWTGTPATKPAVTARRSRAGRMLVYASWNGATEVARWQVLAGRRASRLRGVASKAREGFETEIAARAAARVAVRALDARGKVLGTSRAERPGR